MKADETDDVIITTHLVPFCFLGDSLLFKYSAQVKEKEKEKASAAAVVTSSFVTLFPPLPTPHQFSVVSVPRNFSAADISPAGQKGIQREGTFIELSDEEKILFPLL